MERRIFLAAPALLLVPAGAALAHSEHKPKAGGQAAAQAASAPVSTEATNAGTRDAATYFTNLELLDQEGRKVRFYADALEGKTVMINVIYTNCKDACPMITQQLNLVRSKLPDFGKTIHFISISSDPKRDTPQAMKAFAKKQNADVAGWTWLTGRKENVDHILKKLGQFSAEIESHSTLLIAGNVPAKRWSKIRADAPAGAIADRLSVLAGGPGLVPPAAASAASAADKS